MGVRARVPFQVSSGRRHRTMLNRRLGACGRSSEGSMVRREPRKRHSGVSGSTNRQQNTNVFMRQNRRISGQLDQGNPGWVTRFQLGNNTKRSRLSLENVRAGTGEGVGQGEEGVGHALTLLLFSEESLWYSKLTCSIALSKFSHLPSRFPEGPSAFYFPLTRILLLTHTINILSSCIHEQWPTVTSTLPR